MGELFEELAEAIRAQRPVALVTSVRGPNAGAKLLITENGVVGTLGDADLDRAAATDAVAMLELGVTGTRTYGPSGERRPDDVELFIESFAPPPRMYVFGAIDFAAAVARIGKFLGYRVTVCDPRRSSRRNRDSPK